MNHVSEAAALRRRKPRGQGASRRGEILEAAKRLFTEEGFANATMRRIAAEVGVSPTAIYLHFADKEAILKAIAEDFFTELLVGLTATQASDEPPLARLRAGLRAFVLFSLERADEYRLTFQLRGVKQLPLPADTPKDVADSSFAVLEMACQELIGLGIFRPNDHVLVAETIWVCMHGLASALMDCWERMQTPPEVMIESTLDVVLQGLVVPGVAQGPAAA